MINNHSIYFRESQGYFYGIYVLFLCSFRFQGLSEKDCIYDLKQGNMLRWVVISDLIPFLSSNTFYSQFESSFKCT